MLEEIVVKEVSKNANGWNEIQLEDGRKVSTKKKPLADLAFQSRGTKVAAEITEKQNGKFTNYYLNSIVSLDEAGKDVAPAKPAGSQSSDGVSKSDAVQRQIAAQWAVGRAVEVLSVDGDLNMVDAEVASKVEAYALVFKTLADRVASA